MKRFVVFLLLVHMLLSVPCLCVAESSNDIMHAGDSVSDAAEMVRQSSRYSATIKKLFEIDDKHTWFVSAEGSLTAGTDFPAGWYRLFYVGNGNHANASLYREAIKSDDGLLLFFADSANTLEGYAEAPFAEFVWSMEDGTRYDFIDFPLPEGTKITFESDGNDKFEEVWLWLIERM